MLKINGIHEKLNFIYWCKLFFSYFVSLLNLIHFSEDFYFPLITGFSKTLPTGQCLDKFMQLCSLKVPCGNSYLLNIWLYVFFIYLFHAFPLGSAPSNNILLVYISAAWFRGRLQSLCSSQIWLRIFPWNMVVPAIYPLCACCFQTVYNFILICISICIWYVHYLLYLCRLPCSFVLQGSGLQPAPKSSRASRAMCALQSFMGLLNGKWHFFAKSNENLLRELQLSCMLLVNLMLQYSY